jgi:hypothetical protein
MLKRPIDQTASHSIETGWRRPALIITATGVALTPEQADIVVAAGFAIAGLIGLLFQMHNGQPLSSIMPSNCIIYALKKYLKEGGYLKIRISLRARIFHVLHEDAQGNISHYRPATAHKLTRLIGVPPPLFTGEVATHDIEFIHYDALRRAGYSRRELRQMDNSRLRAAFEQLPGAAAGLTNPPRGNAATEARQEWGDALNYSI